MEQRFAASLGRITLNMQIVPLGNDIQIILTGGEAHIGAVAVASADSPQGSVREMPHHREGELAQKMACRLAKALNVTVSVSAGIHFPHISREEIATVFALADRLTEDALTFLEAHR